MITILSWNIQNGLGVDGQRSLARIAEVIEQHQSPDIICLQEVSRHLALDTGVPAPDQVAELAALFPGHTPVFGPAYDLLPPGTTQRAQYGNMILSRCPVLSSFSHPLPQPPEPGKKQMPRKATEVTVATASGPLRIMTTHLEFHSQRQRQAQILGLRQIHEAIAAIADNPPQATAQGPYQALPRGGPAVLCGDFNCLPSSAELASLLDEAATTPNALIEAWQALHPGRARAPTCGIFDAAQWPQGAHCRDFFVVSAPLASRLTGLQTDVDTAASDHQPIILQLAD